MTGTPGTGKTRVARILAGRFRSIEVRELARERGCAQRRGDAWEVDLLRLDRSLRQRPPAGIDLLVGHLAHLLPVHRAIVLRCHPNELLSRLQRARRGRIREREENALAEALDIVATEVRRRKIPCWEVDSTGRSVSSVAAEVARCLEGRAPRRPRPIDWLADPGVTAHLLDWTL